MTRQRRAILECVRQAKSHPSADEIYEAVRRTLPQVSLGTVYRTLTVLSELGLIRQLGLVGQPKRFDGELGSHYHVRCAQCGQVADIPFAPDPPLNEAAQGLTEYVIHDHHLEFTGLCRACRDASDAQHTDACSDQEED
jgi:Fur family ferric uptake transcriptional regulator